MQVADFGLSKQKQATYVSGVTSPAPLLTPHSNPTNLNTPQVADFGLSKQKQATYVSGVTSLRGTLPWTAPEIIKSPKEVDEKVRGECLCVYVSVLGGGRCGKGEPS